MLRQILPKLLALDQGAEQDTLSIEILVKKPSQTTKERRPALDWFFEIMDPLLRPILDRAIYLGDQFDSAELDLLIRSSTVWDSRIIQIDMCLSLDFSTVQAILTIGK
jgi:hypothetical protein